MNKRNELSLEELEMIVGGSKARTEAECEIKKRLYKNFDVSNYSIETIPSMHKTELDLSCAYEEERFDDAVDICKDAYISALQNNDAEKAINYAEKEAECYLKLCKPGKAAEAYQRGISLASAFGLKETEKNLQVKRNSVLHAQNSLPLETEDGLNSEYDENDKDAEIFYLLNSEDYDSAEGIDFKQDIRCRQKEYISAIKTGNIVKAIEAKTKQASLYLDFNKNSEALDAYDIAIKLAMQTENYTTAMELVEKQWDVAHYVCYDKDKVAQVCANVLSLSKRVSLNEDVVFWCAINYGIATHIGNPSLWRKLMDTKPSIYKQQSEDLEAND